MIRTNFPFQTSVAMADLKSYQNNAFSLKIVTTVERSFRRAIKMVDSATKYFTLH
jgi:hypothetical protein